VIQNSSSSLDPLTSGARTTTTLPPGLAQDTPGAAAGSAERHWPAISTPPEQSTVSDQAHPGAELEPGVALEAVALIYDYPQAANPVRPGLTEPLPLQRWDAAPHRRGPTAIHPLDLSSALRCEGPLTSPALAAHVLRILAAESLELAAVASSSLLVVLSGRGTLQRPAAPGTEPLAIAWGSGDVIVLPAGPTPRLEAAEESSLFWVHDGPLLHYLGVAPTAPRFRPALYRAERLEAELARLEADHSASRANRLSLLLGHTDLPASRTVSHTLWAMLGLVPAGAVQPPHRHQSVAIDLILDCDPGCYTLVGSELDGEGQIRNPRRIEWEPGGVFLTPPGLWHAHVNGSGRTARLMPIQDAGLHTYLRSLDIRFAGGLSP
jgi:quercetin dioxygenase-like cupin family protein